MKKLLSILLSAFFLINASSFVYAENLSTEKVNQNIVNAMTSNHHYSKNEIIQFYKDIGEPIDDIDFYYSDRDYDEYADYFNWIQWINRNGTWSLSIMPYSSKIPILMLYPGDSFLYIKSHYGNSRHWTYYKSRGADESMRLQYQCHVYKANVIKTPWNLEPSLRPEDVGFLCN